MGTSPKVAQWSPCYYLANSAYNDMNDSNNNNNNDDSGGGGMRR